MSCPPSKRSKESPAPMTTSIDAGPIIQSPDTLSLLERLPSELIFLIFDCTPQSVFDLRLTSHYVKSRVDEYARQKANVVQGIRIADRANGFSCLYGILFIKDLHIEFPDGEEDDPTELRMRININPRLEQIFALRLKLHACPFDLKKLVKVRETLMGGELKIYYLLICNSLNFEEKDPGLRYLGECLGRRLGYVDYFIGSEINELPLISSLLDEKAITRLMIRITSLISRPLANHIVQATKMHRVEDLCWNVHKMDPSANAVKILLELSSLVRIMHLYQHQVSDSAGKNYFFGTHDEDWARIILEMFSNKLRKLGIFNHFHVEYLPKDHADFLIEKLPLLNKEIWCSISSEKFHDRGLDYMKNDFYIHATHHENRNSCFLTIAHSTRKDEQMGMFSSI